MNRDKLILFLWRWTSFLRFFKHVVTRLCTDSDEFYVEDLMYHLVVAVATGLVVSARGVSTCEGDFQAQRRIDSFLSGRCVERHLKYLSWVLKHLVPGRGTFLDEGVLTELRIDLIR